MGGWVWSSPPTQSNPIQSNSNPIHIHIYGPHIHGSHIYGHHIPRPHIYSAAGPKQRSEVSFLLACTSKPTHKASGPKQRANPPAPELRSPASRAFGSSGKDGPSRRACSPLLVPNNGRKCRFYWPAQAKPHTSGVVPNNKRTSRRRDSARATSTSTHRRGSARNQGHLKDLEEL